MFGRYSYLRDDDTPVTPLPDGSGSITSGVIGHAITRGHQVVGEYDWTLSPSMLNQARFGYTRRSSIGHSLQNGGITVPGIPCNSFSSVLPIFNVTGFQQIGPTTGCEFAICDLGHRISRYVLDGSRAAHDKVRRRYPARGAGRAESAESDRSVHLHHDRYEQGRRTASGNALASLLLGQVNAFTFDIQKQVLQERAHIAEFFVGDDWKVSDRLTLNIGTRYTLNFPSTEVNNQGAVFNLNTQVLDFPHTARDLECCDFGPRVGLGLPHRRHDRGAVGLRDGLVRTDGITTPFTLPQFPFVQTVGQQSQDNINAAFALANGPPIQVTPPNPNSGLGPGRIWDAAR